MTSLSARLRSLIGFNPIAWEKSRMTMKRIVREFLPTLPQDRAPDRSSDGAGMVVISPWEGSPVPWFSLATGLMLAKRGSDIRFIVDDVWHGGRSFRHAVEMRALREVMALVATRFEVAYLGDMPPASLDDDDDAEIERLARLNAVWALRGEMRQDGREAKIAQNRKLGREAQARIAGFFKQAESTDFLFVPGGMFGDSGLWNREARKHGLRVATYDGGAYETMLVASDGIACQLQDIPRAFRALATKDDDSRDRRIARSRAEEEIDKRRQGRDAFSTQVAGSGTVERKYEGGILLALNSSWDAAALGLHRVYPDNTTWIVETVRCLIENTDRAVIVRQHPAERNAISATSENYRELLSDAFGEHPQLHFIAAADPINSYELLEQVAAVLTHTSTIGSEAVALGVPVITGSAPYYADLGFVDKATTVEEYEALLARADKGELAVDDERRDAARLCYYLTQCCNWTFTTFNPTNIRWSAKSLAEWQDVPAVARMLESIATGTPVALLNHEANRAAA